MIGEISLTEFLWSAFTLAFFCVSVLRYVFAVVDWHYADAETLRMARNIMIMRGAACIAWFFWFLAGALSVVRHFLVDETSIGSGLLVVTLFVAMFAFGAYTITDAVTRIRADKL